MHEHSKSGVWIWQPLGAALALAVRTAKRAGGKLVALVALVLAALALVWRALQAGDLAPHMAAASLAGVRFSAPPPAT